MIDTSHHSPLGGRLRWLVFSEKGYPRTGQDRSGLRSAAADLRGSPNRKRAMAHKVSVALGGNLRGKTVGVLGLTFKSDTDDMREAPSNPLIAALQNLGATVQAYDPLGIEQAKGELPANVRCCDDA